MDELDEAVDELDDAIDELDEVDELDETAGGLGPPQGSVDSRSEAT